MNTDDPSERGHTRYLTGHGGLGLVVFHLARQKIEFALTPERSPFGDIWIQVAGSKIGVEVKTCRHKEKWQIKRSQIRNVEFYILVSMGAACCFVLSVAEIEQIISSAPVIYGDVHMIEKRQLPDGTMNAWKKFGQIRTDIVPTAIPTTGWLAKRGAKPGPKRPKIVRKILAGMTWIGLIGRWPLETGEYREKECRI